jgi:hypothetical protein
MKTLLIGNGYWGNIIKKKLKNLTELLYTADSKDNIVTLLNNNIDFVFVCTPTETHYDIVKTCILNNKNIFCEKPFTNNINQAQELYLLAEKFNINIFVDNIFLYRNEIINIYNKEFLKIKFVWKKYEEIMKDNLINSLFYHDLYLLIHLYDDNWSIKTNNIEKDKLYIELINNEKQAYFEYDRKFLGKKEKKIIFDNNFTLDLSTPINDPLSDIINKIINREIDYIKNKNITIKTLKLIEKFKINY